MIDPKNFLSYGVWLALPMNVRLRFSVVFNIPRTGRTEVFVGRDGVGSVTSDGFSPQVVAEKMTLPLLQKYLGLPPNESGDYYKTFELAVSKVENLADSDVKQFDEPLEVRPAPTPEVGPAEAGPAKGRAAKKRKAA